MIFIHEFGHFFFAKLFGIGVEQFSFGFGPRLFGIKVGDTDYRLNWIPLGGYVKMVGDDPFEEPDAMSEDSYLGQAVWKRLIVAGAGPAFNLILPIFLLSAVYMAGSPETIAWVGTLESDSVAAKAGLKEGDRIIALNGEALSFWTELNDGLTQLDEGAAYTLTVERDGGAQEITIPQLPFGEFAGQRMPEPGFSRLSTRPFISVVEGSPAQMAGLQDGDRVVSANGLPVEWWHDLNAHIRDGQSLTLEVKRGGNALKGQVGDEVVAVNLMPERYATSWASDNESTPFISASQGADGFSAQWFFDLHPSTQYGILPLELQIGDVSETMPAYAAGVKSGDKIVGLAGLGVKNWAQVVREVGGTLDGPVRLTVLRGTQFFGFAIQPEITEQMMPSGEALRSAKVGIGPSAGVDAPSEPMRLGVVAALGKGATETGYVIVTTVKIIGKVISGDIPVEESIGGPIAIVQYAQEAASVSIFRYFKMMALISVSLGLMNLLPIPLLDGGHILFFTVEAIRGQPVSLRFREISHQVGLIFLLTLIAFAIINDTRIHILN